MASKGHGNRWFKKAKKGPDNLFTGQYTPPPPPPLVTKKLQPAATNIILPSRATISLPNAFFMPPQPHQFQPSSPYNSLHSSSSSVPSTSSTPSLSRLRIGGPSTSTSPSINSVAASNAIPVVSQILKFKEVVEYDGNERLMISPDGNRFIPACSEYENGGKKHPFIDVYEEMHRKKNKGSTRGDWVEIRAKNAYEEFQKSIEEWRQTKPTSEGGTMVQPSPAELNNMWTTVVGGPKKGRTYGTRNLQSSSSPSLFPSSSSTLQTMEQMEVMKKKIVELTRKYAANDAMFAKFDKLEELVKKHMPQVFHDEEDNESDNN
ncbi:hypothetical protein P3L10_001971 [Capsicum annuum]